MTKILEARVRQKADTIENLMNNDLPLLDGEQVFVRSDVDGGVMGFKIGTEGKRFSELPYPDLTVRGKVSPTSSWVGRQSGVYIPTLNGVYNGVNVNLLDGYQVLYWDGSTIEKVVYPAEYNTAVFGGVIDSTKDLSTPPSVPTWYIASAGTYNTVPETILTENSILSWDGSTWSNIPFELEIRGEFLVADNVSEVRNITPQIAQLLVNGTYKAVQVLGYYQPGDTPSPINYYVSDTIHSDDGGSVFEVGGIKLEHDFGGYVDVRYFGLRQVNTDNSIEFLKVLNYIYKTGSKLLLPSNHNYKFTNSITIEQTIQIEGNNCEFEAMSGVTNDFIVFKGDYNIVENFHVKGIWVNNQSGDLSFEGSYNRITDCYFSKGSNAGIKLEASNGNIISGCRFEDKSFGILLRESFSNSILNNYFTKGYRRGVLTPDGGGYITVPLGDGIKMSSGLTTFNLTKGGVKTTIIGNVFDNVYRDAIDLFSDGEDIVFSNNIVLAPEALGMDIKTIYRDFPDTEGGTSIIEDRQTRNIVISGNYFEDCGLSSEDSCAISIRHSEYRQGETPSIPKGVHNVTINGNQFHRGQKSAIILEYCKNVSINGNVFKDVPKESIHINRESENIVINGNIIEINNPLGYGIYATHNENYKDILISNNIIKTSDFNAIAGILQYGKDITIIGNSIIGFVSGILLERASNCNISNNTIKNSSQQGIRLSSAAYSVDNISVQSNRIEDCSRCILYNANSSNIVCTNNIFKNWTVAAESNVNLVNNYQTNGNFKII